MITAVGSTRVTSSAQIRAIIAGHEPGDALTLTIKRNGSSKTVHVTLGSAVLQRDATYATTNVAAKPAIVSSTRRHDGWLCASGSRSVAPRNRKKPAYAART